MRMIWCVGIKLFSKFNNEHVQNFLLERNADMDFPFFRHLSKIERGSEFVGYSLHAWIEYVEILYLAYACIGFSASVVLLY